ncbi:MAG: hypothetical protein PWP31_1789, partial [Clostridia bacterium]|nr:hypothetical protein [Clostridia bacterium]
ISYSSCPVAWKTSMSGMGVSLPEGKMLTTQIALLNNSIDNIYLYDYNIL